MQSTFGIKIIDTGDHLKCYHQRFGNKLPKAWFRYLGKAVSSDFICFNSRKSLLAGHHVQIHLGSAFSLCCVTRIQKSIPGSLAAQGWLAIADRDLSNEAGEDSSGGVFSIHIYKSLPIREKFGTQF